VRTSDRRSRRAALAAGAALALLTTACGGGSGFDSDNKDSSGDGGGDGGGALQLLIGSSGPAETDAVTAAADKWSEESGTDVEVIAATDLNQQLSQGFAANEPPDVFYLGSDNFAEYAANGSLLPYAGDLENADDFYPNLAEAFTYEDEFYCAPKDFSTLGLVINTDKWEEAGLTDDDIPTTWDELRDVAKTLTKDGQAGLVTSTEYQRLGALMAEAGGGLVQDGEAIADDDANVEALTFIKEMLTEDSWQTTGDVGAGWGGEAFGTGKAAMTIEGNWIAGALKADFPDVKYTVVPLPEGPDGAATLSFTNCWGIAADSGNTEGAQDLVSFLTSADQQIEFAKAFGVMPSIQSAADAYAEEFPELAAFVEQGDVAQTVPNQPGVSEVIADFNTKLESLESSDPADILAEVQSNLESALQD
jgi:multiple sugar transport system substrate-binding protein